MLNILSLGAGVQSSKIALASEHGELPKLDAAIFSDTGGEPQEVYDWLEFLKTQLSFPVYTVKKEPSLRTESLRLRDHPKGYKYIRGLIPAYIDGYGLLGRSCTNDFKIQPVRKKVKELLGLKPNDRFPKELAVRMWLGISLDEIQRMKVSVEPWQEFWHPLIENRETRHDCLLWMKRNDYPEPPRSACYFCPFHSNEEWRRIKDTMPEEWDLAVKYDEELRERSQEMFEAGHIKGLPYLHKDRVPLEEADLSTAEDHGQMSFLDECAGMCGV